MMEEEPRNVEDVMQKRQGGGGGGMRGLQAAGRVGALTGGAAGRISEGGLVVRDGRA